MAEPSNLTGTRSGPLMGVKIADFTQVTARNAPMSAARSLSRAPCFPNHVKLGQSGVTDCLSPFCNHALTFAQYQNGPTATMMMSDFG